MSYRIVPYQDVEATMTIGPIHERGSKLVHLDDQAAVTLLHQAITEGRNGDSDGTCDPVDAVQRALNHSGHCPDSVGKYIDLTGLCKAREDCFAHIGLNDEHRVTTLRFGFSSGLANREADPDVTVPPPFFTPTIQLPFLDYLELRGLTFPQIFKWIAKDFPRLEDLHIARISGRNCRIKETVYAAGPLRIIPHFDCPINENMVVTSPLRRIGFDCCDHHTFISDGWLGRVHWDAEIMNLNLESLLFKVWPIVKDTCVSISFFTKGHFEFLRKGFENAKTNRSLLGSQMLALYPDELKGRFLEHPEESATFDAFLRAVPNMWIRIPHATSRCSYTSDCVGNLERFLYQNLLNRGGRCLLDRRCTKRPLPLSVWPAVLARPGKWGYSWVWPSMLWCHRCHWDEPEVVRRMVHAELIFYFLRRVPDLAGGGSRHRAPAAGRKRRRRSRRLLASSSRSRGIET